MALLAALCVSNSSAFAQSSSADTYALEWTREPGAESCVSSSALSRLLEQTVGPVLRQRSEATLRIDGVVRRAETAGWQVRIQLTDADGTVVGEREIADDAPQCSAITQSVLLVLAFIIDPELAARGLPDDVKAALARDDVGSAPAEAEQMKPAVRPALRPDDAEVRDAQADSAPPAGIAERYETDPAVYANASVALGAEILPQAAPGFSAELRWAAWKKWALGVSGAFWLPVTVPVGGYRALDGGVVFNAAHVSASVCRRLFDGTRWVADGCAGAILGARWTQAPALQQENGERREYFGPLVATETRFYLSPSWFVSGDLTVALSARRDRFVYEQYEGGEQLLFAPGMLFGWASAGLGANL